MNKDDFFDLVDDILEQINKGLTVGEAASEVEWQRKLDGIEIDSVDLDNAMHQAATDFWDYRADIARDYRDLSC